MPPSTMPPCWIPGPRSTSRAREPPWSPATGSIFGRRVRSLTALRAALVCERGDALCIGMGMPREWLASGSTVPRRRPPTAFGSTSFELHYDRETHAIEGSVTVAENCDASQLRVYLRIPSTMTPRTAGLPSGLRIDQEQPIASGARSCPCRSSSGLAGVCIQRPD